MLPIYFDIGGHWKELENCWMWCQVQSEAKVIMVEEESPKLVDKICEKGKIDREKHSLKIIFLP